MNKSKRLLKLTKHSIYKSLIVVTLFIAIAIAQHYNLEIIRDKFEDLGFDKTAKMFFSTKKEKLSSAPNVVGTDKLDR